jgi:hypothetical protein
LPSAAELTMSRRAAGVLARALRGAGARLSGPAAPLVPAASLGAAAASPAAAALLSRRAASSGAASALAEALQREIEYEGAHYAQPEELAGGPPPPFTLTEAQGDALLTLERTFTRPDGREEVIIVELVSDDQPEEEEEELDFDGGGGEAALDLDVGVAFTVEVDAGGPEALL